MAKWEHKLPAVLEPVGDICLQISIPAHPDYVALFIRAVRMLETNRLYERDEALSAKVVVSQWRQRTITPMIEALSSATGNCQDLDGECLTYPPFASFVSYSPQNPYTEPDLIPEGFEQPPFFVNGKDGAHDLPNYNKGDVILDFGSINIEPSWDLAKTPRIELCLEGSGVAEIHLLKIVQGGMAIVSLDNPIDLGDIIAGIIGDGVESYDLNQDITSLPPETAEEVILELDVPTEGEHVVYIYFLPVVNDSLIPLGFGGGLREISLCGNLRPCGVPAPEPPPPLDGVTELKPEFQFTADCGLEYRLRDQEDNIVQDWTPVAGWIDNAAACFGGGDTMTWEDYRDGIVAAAEIIGLRIGSGEIVPFSVDSEGEVVVGSGDAGGDGEPEDDPTTVFNETLAARAGGVKTVTAGIQEILNNCFTWKAAGTITDQQAADRLVLLYNYEPAAAASFTNYWWTVYNNSQGQVTLNTAVVDGNFFCKGLNMNSFAEYVYEVHATALEVPVLEKFIQYFPVSQLDVWYQRGIEVPSTAYETYSCTKIATETFTLNFALAESFTIPFAGTFKAGHRYLVQASGSFVDADVANEIQDFFWKKNTSTGVLTFTGFTLSVSGTTNATSAQVPYRSDHIYNWTFDKTGTDGGSFTKSNDTFTNPNVTGTITVTVTDLGEFAL